MTRQERNAILRTVPKVELHVHLEGSIQPETLLELARRNSVALPAHTAHELRSWYRFRDFPHFADVYRTVCRCIRSPADIELVLRRFLETQARQNVLYSEVTFTALTHYRNYGISLDDQVRALDDARRWAERELGVSCGIIPDIPREHATDDEALLIADWVAANLGETIVALGLGGYEVGYPPERFSKAFRRALDRGVRSVVHAGETEGAPSVWGALRELGAVRIGHGTRSLEDVALVDYLAEHAVPLELCLSSNVCLGVVSGYEQHPLPDFVRRGIRVTLNTDDPPMFSTDLVREYEVALDTFGLGLPFIADCLETAFGASLAPEGFKSRIEATIRDGVRRLRDGA